MQLISISALSALCNCHAGSVQAIPSHDLAQRASSHHRAIAVPRDVRAANARGAATSATPPRTLKSDPQPKEDAVLRSNSTYNYYRDKPSLTPPATLMAVRIITSHSTSFHQAPPEPPLQLPLATIGAHGTRSVPRRQQASSTLAVLGPGRSTNGCTCAFVRPTSLLMI